MNPDQLIAQFGEQQVAGFMLVLGRVGPLFLLAPMFSSRMMPARAKSASFVVRRRVVAFFFKPLSVPMIRNATRIKIQSGDESPHSTRRVAALQRFLWQR